MKALINDFLQLMIEIILLNVFIFAGRLLLFVTEVVHLLPEVTSRFYIGCRHVLLLLFATRLWHGLTQVSHYIHQLFGFKFVHHYSEQVPQSFIVSFENRLVRLAFHFLSDASLQWWNFIGFQFSFFKCHLILFRLLLKFIFHLLDFLLIDENILFIINCSLASLFSNILNFFFLLNIFIIRWTFYWFNCSFQFILLFYLMFWADNLWLIYRGFNWVLLLLFIYNNCITFT
jgi:hypothetical protein